MLCWNLSDLFVWWLSYNLQRRPCAVDGKVQSQWSLRFVAVIQLTEETLCGWREGTIPMISSLRGCHTTYRGDPVRLTGRYNPNDLFASWLSYNLQRRPCAVDGTLKSKNCCGLSWALSFSVHFVDCIFEACTGTYNVLSELQWRLIQHCTESLRVRKSPCLWHLNCSIALPLFLVVGCCFSSFFFFLLFVLLASLEI